MSLVELLLDEKRTVSCTSCGSMFSPYDLASGAIFPQTLTCVRCYGEMARNPDLCFAKQYDPEDTQCSVWCEDRSICAAWRSVSRRAALEEKRRERLLVVLSEYPLPKGNAAKTERHPFGRKQPVLRLVWEMASRGTTIREIEQFLADAGVDLEYVLSRLGRGRRGPYRWKWLLGGDGAVKIEWEQANG